MFPWGISAHASLEVARMSAMVRVLSGVGWYTLGMRDSVSWMMIVMTKGWCQDNSCRQDKQVSHSETYQIHTTEVHTLPGTSHTADTELLRLAMDGVPEREEDPSVVVCSPSLSLALSGPLEACCV